MKRKIILIILVCIFNVFWVKGITITNKLATNYNIVIKTNSKTKLNNNAIMEELDVLLRTDLSYENEDSLVIAKKINNYLKNEMSGKGEIIAKYSIANNLNPYLVASMIIEATGCDSECSFLVKKCNNVGKMYYDKNTNDEVACYGGYYQQFNSLDDSIKEYIKYIEKNFYEKELTTPSQIYKEYNKDVRWVFRVNENIEKIKNSTAK